MSMRDPSLDLGDVLATTTATAVVPFLTGRRPRKTTTAPRG